MKFIPVILLTCWAILGCSTTPTNIGNGYTITHKINNTFQIPLVTIEYRDYQDVLKNMIKNIDNRLGDDEEKKEAALAIPKGGYIYVEIERATLEAANTKWFEFVILKHGKNIYREKGKSKIPNTPSSNRRWWNVQLVPIENVINDEITFYVIDNVLGGRDEFVIKSPNLQRPDS